MTNKYLEKVAEITDREVESELKRQALVNTARSSVLPPGVGPILNAIYSPDTLSDLRHELTGKGGRKGGDWIVPAMYGVGGGTLGLTGGAAVGGGLGSLAGPVGALGGAIGGGLAGSLAGTYQGTYLGLKDRIKDALREAKRADEE